MKRKKASALMLAAALLLTLCACAGGNPASTVQPTQSQPPAPADTAQPTAAPTAAPSAAPSTDPTAAPSPSQAPADAAPGDAVRFAVLSGPTGIGAASMLDKIDHDPAGLHTGYSYTIAADNTELVAGLTKGTLDIATMASNAAVNLFNKTGGGVRIIALGTLGVLHILEGGDTSIRSISDLAGKTLWCTGQGANPEYVIRFLLSENGLDPDSDVELVFAEPSEITQKLLTGQAQCAMLPVPAATAAVIKGEGKVRFALDLTDEWDALNTGSQFIMTAVVARTEFVNAAPDKVNAFLKDYSASIDFVQNNVDAASAIIADLGITPSAGIAKQAIPQCHLAYIAGRAMAPAISGYFEVLHEADPASVGGKLPDDSIYYVP